MQIRVAEKSTEQIETSSVEVEDREEAMVKQVT